MPPNANVDLKLRLTQRICFGQPPQILVIIGPSHVITDPKGSPIRDVDGSAKHTHELMFQNMRPQVHVNEPPCSCYEPRAYHQIEHQDAEAPAVETKQ